MKVQDACWGRRLGAVFALAAAVATRARSIVIIYSNDFAPAATAHQLSLEGASHDCYKRVKSGALKIQVGSTADTCSYRLPVRGRQARSPTSTPGPP